MKKIITILLMLILCLSTASCGGNEESEPESQNISFHDMTISIPADLEYDTELSDGYNDYYKTYTEDGITNEMLYLSIIQGLNIDDDASMNEYIDGMREEMTLRELSEIRSSSISGHAYKAFDFQSQINGESYYINQYLVTVEDDTYSIMYMSLSETGIDLMDGLFKTIQFTNLPEETEPTTESVTLGEQNALDTAHDYLDYSGFSYSGLIDQLEFEGYTTEEAIYAVDNCGADWNEQAALVAQDYLDSSSFSRQGLIDQLIFEGFTQEQAEYGVSAVGY